MQVCGVGAFHGAPVGPFEEMNRANAIEVMMPFVTPSDLWEKSGRWDVYGKELLRFKDRADRDFCLGPTHEEVVTDLETSCLSYTLQVLRRSYHQVSLW